MRVDLVSFERRKQALGDAVHAVRNMSNKEVLDRGISESERRQADVSLSLAYGALIRADRGGRTYDVSTYSLFGFGGKTNKDLRTKTAAFLRDSGFHMLSGLVAIRRQDVEILFKRADIKMPLAVSAFISEYHKSSTRVFYRIAKVDPPPSTNPQPLSQTMPCM